MLTVVIESPYAADTAAGIARNVRYLRACMAYCLAQDAAPYASHALYTQPGVLNDKLPEERKKGMRAGFAIAGKMDERWVFTDLGITDGMLRGEEAAKKKNQPIRRLSIPEWDRSPVLEDDDVDATPGMTIGALRSAIYDVRDDMRITVRLSDDCGGIISASTEVDEEGLEHFGINASNEEEDFEDS